ncbi:MAG: DoxX family membrane protein [Bacteroidales bacterium]
MHILRAISRVLIGAVFILSGFFKAIDPIGGGLKIKEYLAAFHLGFIDFMDIPFAIMLAVAEFIIGVSILKGLRMKFFAIAVFWFMLFFTMLTLYSAIYNPVKDCGCFGEAVHLTNWQTFYKNIVLILAAWILYLQRNRV